MKTSAIAWRFCVFAVVMLLILAGLVIVFGKARFGATEGYRAYFSSASALKEGQTVRIAGVDVGRVTSVSVVDDKRAEVGFTVDSAVTLTGGTHAVIRYQNLIGDRYLELTEGAGDSTPLAPGSAIPESRTSPALDLDALIGGFKPLLKAMDPAQVNGISTALVKVLQGQGGTIDDILRQVGEATSTFADQDELIGSVINNLNGVLRTVNAQNKQFDDGVDKLQLLVSELGGQSDRLAGSVANISQASKSVANLLDQSRPAISEDVTQVQRFSSTVNNDHAYVDQLLTELPQSYRTLSRLGLYGAFFTFYLCDATLKVNGPKGDPVYIDVVGQRAGRCTPP